MRIFVIKSNGFKKNKETGEILYKDKCQDAYMWTNDGEDNIKIIAGCVCDGVGSLKNSHKAAEYTANEMKKFVEEKQLNSLKDSGDIIKTIENQIIKVHNSDFWNKDENIGSATTLVFTVLNKITGKYYIANIGDSRCYKIDTVNNQIECLTQDQEDKNGTLIYAINCHQVEEIEIGFTEGNFEKGDMFLLATDGLFKRMNDNEILSESLKVLKAGIKGKKEDFKKAFKEFEKKIRDKNEQDDITILLMYLD